MNRTPQTQASPTGLAAVALLAAALGGACKWTPEGVEVRLSDGTPLEFPAELVEFDNDRGESIMGVMVRPDAPTPMPTVVMLHGSGGLFNTAERNDVNLVVARQFADWTTTLTREGYAVLLPSSFYSRGYFEWDDRPNDIDEVERLVMRTYDAHAAVRYACEQSFVDCSHLGLLGFSNGGSVAMMAVAEGLDEIPGMQALTPAASRDAVATAHAYYPGCDLQGRLEAADLTYYPSAPIEVYHGSEDPIGEPCPDRLEEARAEAELRGLTQVPMSLVIYDGAGHSFDSKANNEAEYAARDDAYDRTLEGLAAALMP